MNVLSYFSFYYLRSLDNGAAVSMKRHSAYPYWFLQGCISIPEKPKVFALLLRVISSAGIAKTGCILVLLMVSVVSFAQSLPVRVQTHPIESSMPNMLLRAWQAWQSGHLTQAAQYYTQTLKTDPHHRDARLGLAAVLVKQGKPTEAVAQYQYLLSIDEKDTDALAGLFAIVPRRLDPQIEIDLRQQTSSAAFLLLAQYYAQQARWTEAQEQYFLAFSLDPENADLAFNLAISLDHLKQSRLACDYYEKALALAEKKMTLFDLHLGKNRLNVLKQQMKPNAVKKSSS